MIRRICCLLLFWSMAVYAGDEDRIVQRYKELLQKNPVEGTVLDRLWGIYQERNETARLLEEYASQENAFPGAMIHGFLLSKAGKQPEARQAFKKAAELNPRSAAPWLALAGLDSEPAAAKAADLAEAAERQPSPELRLREGNAWLAANDRSRAVSAWSAAVALAPGDLPLRQELARTYQANGLLEEAIAEEEYIAGHAAPAGKAQALDALAQLQQTRGNPDAAIDALQRALALLGPGHWMRESLEVKMVRLHQRYHRIDELEEKWKAAADAHPNDLGAQLPLIALYQQAGKTEDLIQTLKHILQLAPDKKDYKLQLARALLQTVQLDQAAAVLDELISDQPANGELVFERAELDIKREQPREAETRIEHFLAEHPDPNLAARALDFYKRNRLFAPLEKRLTDAAKAGGEPALALAGFQLDRKQTEAAVNSIRSAAATQAPASVRADLLSRGAALLRERELFSEATSILREAVGIAPESPELHVQYGQALASSGKPVEGLHELEEAYRLEPSDNNDQQLFQYVSSHQFQTDSAGPKASTRASPSPTPAQTSRAIMLPAYVTQLTAAAESSGDLKTLLRAARWNAWSQNSSVALRLSERVLAADPKNIPARELIARLSDLSTLGGMAEQRLNELMALNPGQAAEYKRQLAEIAMRAGNGERSLELFNEIAEALPGNLRALTDLAVAQQRADRWFDALGTWEKAYAAAPESKRPEIVRPLLQVLDRLALHKKAAELLLSRLTTSEDEGAQQAVLGDLIALCEQHNLLDWLRHEFDTRHQARPNDYFVSSAYARILKRCGRPGEAFSILGDAAAVAPEQTTALEHVVDEAEDMGNLDAALATQRRVVRLAPPDSPAALEQLAELLERTLQIDEASKVWSQATRLFGRDSAVLHRAADFYNRWCDSAKYAEMLRRIRALDSTDIEALSELALVSNVQESLSCWEQILSITAPLKDSDPMVYPPRQSADPGTVQHVFMRSAESRGARPDPSAAHAIQTFWSDAGSKISDAAKYRLIAIREISRTLSSGSDAAALRTWLDRWGNGAPETEALWAYFYANRPAEWRPILERNIQKHPEDLVLKSAYTWLMLEANQYEALAEWLLSNARLPVDRDGFPVALSQHLQFSHPPQDICARLFPPGFDRLRALLWQSAVTFAGAGRLEEAVQLGSRVTSRSTYSTSEYAIEFAHWQIMLGDSEGARSTLRDALKSGAANLDHPLFRAMREYFLLLPQSERSPFVESYLAEVEPGTTHARLSEILLYSLNGQTERSRAAIDSLLQTRTLSGGSDDFGQTATSQRYWNFLLSTGLQLEAYHLEPAAAYLWQQSLADSAAVRLQSEEVTPITRELRLRQAFREISSAPRRAQGELIEQYLRNEGPEQATVLGMLFESNKFAPEARETFYAVWKSNRENPQYTRNLLGRVRDTADRDRVQSILQEMCSNLKEDGDHTLNREVLLQAANLLALTNQPAKARETLISGLPVCSADRMIVSRIIELAFQEGNRAAAEEWLAQLPPGDARGQLTTAAFLIQLKQEDAAERLLESLRIPEADTKLAELCVARGELDRARWFTHQLLKAGRFDAVGTIATELHGKEPELALKVLSDAVFQCHDANLAFPLQRKIVEWLGAEDPRFEGQCLRLKKLADGYRRVLPGAYYDAVAAIPQHLDKIESLLKADFGEGQGTPTAGVKLVQLEIQARRPKEVPGTVDAILQSNTVTEADLIALHNTLRLGGFPALAGKVAEPLAKKEITREEWPLQLIRDLIAAGKREEALARLDQLAPRTAYDEDLASEVADMYQALEKTPEAERYFLQALTADSLAGNFKPFAAYAQLLQKAGRLNDARRILKTGYRNPANQDMKPLAELLKTSGRMQALEHETLYYELTEIQRQALLKELER